ncbi:MAG: two-component system, cell cycle sensor histidine kinase and response regulator CckA [Gaiellaceae bacterium]|jgi:CheY-like chemotaxis protein|nr:two-component system, cell cycle sensor histidine kinase and response regulator CckA [Gaiellaceae bacterium]
MTSSEIQTGLYYGRQTRLSQPFLPLTESPKPPLSVLLVDDELVVRQVLTEMLQTQGHTVTSTDDPEHALELASAGGVFDLLITDLVMPKLDGYELAVAVAERAPKLKVIFISGYTSETDRLGLGGDGVAFLQKPFKIEELEAKVREVLGD